MGSARPAVMIVDDEPTTVDVLEVLLQGEGYTRLVTTTEPGRALELLARTVPDVLLLNLLMPEVGGLEILAAMRKDAALARIPVHILTSSTDAEAKLAALELGAHDFLAKPVDPSELALRLRNTLALRALHEGPGPARPSADRLPELTRPLPSAGRPAPGASAVGDEAPQAGRPLVSRLAGVSPRLRAIADKFVDRLEEKLAEMEQSRRACDFDALVDFAHWLRGAAGTVGFDAFTGPAEAFKAHARARSADEVDASIREILALAARVTRSGGRP